MGCTSHKPRLADDEKRGEQEKRELREQELEARSGQEFYEWLKRDEAPNDEYSKIWDEAEPYWDEEYHLEQDLRALKIGPCNDETSRQVRRDFIEQKLQEVRRKLKEIGISRIAISNSPSTRNELLSSEEGIQFCFYRTGTDYWKVGAKGSEVPIKDIQGMRFIHCLLKNPAIGISPVALYHGGNSDVVPFYDGRKSVDHKSRRQMLQCIKECEEKLKETTDLEKREELEGLIGQARKSLNQDDRDQQAENARKGIQKAIDTALKKIEGNALSVASLLRKGLKTGSICIYVPDPTNPVAWILDSPT